MSAVEITNTPEQIAKAASFFDILMTAKEKHGKDWWANAEIERIQQSIAQDQLMGEFRAILEWVRANYAAGSTAEINAKIDAALALEVSQFSARHYELATERRELFAALKSSIGYLLNAKIDLETGAPKKTAIKTIEGGLSMARAAVSKAEGGA